MRRWPRSVHLRFSILVLVAVALITFATWTIFGPIGDEGAKIGYLIVGAVISASAVVAYEWYKEARIARDLSISLHAELADRVARCCVDFETWHPCLATGSGKPRDTFDVRKFLPTPPVVYPATASQISILGADAVRSTIQFYYRLSACGRDFENIAAKLDKSGGNATPKQLQLIARRFKETLRPGRDAILALGSTVNQSEGIEDAALACYDATHRDRATETSLRKRLDSLINT